MKIGTRVVRSALFVCGLLAVRPTWADEPTTPSVQFHGYMQNRLYADQGACPTYKPERISLSAAATLPYKYKAYAEVYYHDYAPKRFYLESGYFDAPLAGGTLRVGKGRLQTFGITPSYPNRKTSNYGLISEAFTQDRVHGLQYMLNKDVLDFGLSLHTSYRFGKRSAGDLPGDALHAATHTVSHFAFRDTQDQLSHNLQVSGRIGGHTKNGFRAGFSGSYGTIDSRDLDSLRGTDNALRPRNPLTGTVSSAIGPGFTGRDIRVIGADYTYKDKTGFMTQGERYWSHVSDMDFGGWSLLMGIEPKVGWKVYFRYGQQDTGLARTDNPLTWGTNQMTFSAVQPISKNVWMQYEYEINGEQTNTPSRVKNDLFFAELFVAF